MINTAFFHSPLRQTTLMAAFALLIVTTALLLLLHQPAEAQSDAKATSNLALTSPNPGELSITWDTPRNPPDDYRQRQKPIPAGAAQ